MTSVRVEADDRGGATLTVGHPPINLVLVLGCDDIDAHTAERWG